MQSQLGNVFPTNDRPGTLRWGPYGKPLRGISASNSCPLHPPILRGRGGSERLLGTEFTLSESTYSTGHRCNIFNLSANLPSSDAYIWRYLGIVTAFLLMTFKGKPPKYVYSQVLVCLRRLHMVGMRVAIVYGCHVCGDCVWHACGDCAWLPCLWRLCLAFVWQLAVVGMFVAIGRG